MRFLKINAPNSMTPNNAIGTTQCKSIRKPKTRFPNRAPILPNVNDNAAAITLKQLFIKQLLLRFVIIIKAFLISLIINKKKT